MGLKITLKPNERVVVNGCVIRNTERRHVLIIESRADVVRGEDLLDEDAPVTPVREAYFLIQAALIQPDLRPKLVPAIQTKLVDIALIYTVRLSDGVFEAANYIAVGDFYKAMAALRPLMRHEREVMEYIEHNQAEAEATLAAAQGGAEGKGGPDGMCPAAE